MSDDTSNSKINTVRPKSSQKRDKDRDRERIFSRNAPYDSSTHLKRVRIIADFQFGKGVGMNLFPDNCEFKLSATKRVRYVMIGGDRIATVRANDGRLTLSQVGAKRLYDSLSAPAYRVCVKNEVAEFVSAGKNAMAKHVVAADIGIRADDEVLVCDEDGKLLATGTALLSGVEMTEFNYGVAVGVRKGN